MDAVKNTASTHSPQPKKAYKRNPTLITPQGTAYFYNQGSSTNKSNLDGTLKMEPKLVPLLLEETSICQSISPVSCTLSPFKLPFDRPWRSCFIFLPLLIALYFFLSYTKWLGLYFFDQITFFHGSGLCYRYGGVFVCAGQHLLLCGKMMNRIINS